MRVAYWMIAGLVGCVAAEDEGPASGVPIDPPVGEDSSTPPGSTGNAGSSGGTSTPAPAGTSGAVDDDDTVPEIIYDLAVPDAPPVPEGCVQDVDIVFVMDVSTTMGSFIDTLADSILQIDSALGDFALPDDPHYGLVVFVDDAEVINEGMPYTDAETLKADFEMWAAFTSSNQQVGGGNSNTTWPENSLDALYLAAEEFEWREDTTRIIIHATDDTFWEGPATQNGVMILHDYPETVTALQNNTARVFAMADMIGGSCECLDVAPGWFVDYNGMPAIPEATDGGIVDINDVLSGTVSIADAITTAVEESYCQPYDPVG